MWYGFGNKTITSTQTEKSNPSTTTLIAELSSLAANDYEMRVLVGASTVATFIVEQGPSTDISVLREGGAYLGRRFVYGTVNQTAQYILRFRAEQGDYVRVRVAAAIGAGNAAATIQLEPMD